MQHVLSFQVRNPFPTIQVTDNNGNNETRLTPNAAAAVAADVASSNSESVSDKSSERAGV